MLQAVVCYLSALIIYVDRNKMKKSLQILFSILLLTLISACATNLAGRTQVMLVSEDKAIEASKEAYIATMEDFKQKGQLDKDPGMVKRVNEITTKLIRQAKILRPSSSDWEWSVKVIDEPETINAWCMAGGRMAIYSGLINKLSATDDEIAQVMGHEISHALANHTAERMSVAMASGLAVDLYNSTVGESTGTTSLASAAAQVALTLPNSRTGESEADKIGIELAAKAGYNPNAAVTLWQKMAAAGGGSSLEFLSTHPAPENREKALKKLIPQMMPYYQAAK